MGNLLEISKTQNVRLLDIFFVGPMMVYASTFSGMPYWLKSMLMITGILTIAYNGNNYLQQKSFISESEES